MAYLADMEGLAGRSQNLIGHSSSGKSVLRWATVGNRGTTLCRMKPPNLPDGVQLSLK
ncbi:MAG TPA: hypothetical protein VNT26_24715 [Candidatus Sulfotelmatobacter sp.]|nr:hypothetical protein [Candidatus Sulfotelmatobacter sp.]